LFAKYLGGFESGHTVEERPERDRSLPSLRRSGKPSYLFDYEGPELLVRGWAFLPGRARHHDFVQRTFFPRKPDISTSHTPDRFLWRLSPDRSTEDSMQSAGRFIGQGGFEMRSVGEITVKRIGSKPQGSGQSAQRHPAQAVPVELLPESVGESPKCSSPKVFRFTVPSASRLMGFVCSKSSDRALLRC
jgi:hypothetical protein